MKGAYYLPGATQKGTTCTLVMTMLARNNRYRLLTVLLAAGVIALLARALPVQASITLVGVTVTETQVNGNTVMQIEWETATEIDTAGFYIQRRNGTDDAFERISGNLIPAQGDGAIGAIYSFEDTNPGSNPEYILEDVSNANLSTKHGPYKPASDTTASPQPGSNDPTATTTRATTPTNTPQPTTVVGTTSTPQPTSAAATSTPQPTNTAQPTNTPQPSGGNNNDDDTNNGGSNPGVSSDPTATLTPVPTTSSNNNSSNSRGGSSNPTSVPPTPTPTDIMGAAQPTATRAPLPPPNPYTPPASVAQSDPDPFVLGEGSDGGSAPGNSSHFPTAAPPIVSVPTSVAPGNAPSNNASRSQPTLTPFAGSTRAPAYYPPPGLSGSTPGSGTLPVPSPDAMPPVAAGNVAPTPNAAGRALLQNPEFSDQQPTTAELATAPTGGNGIWFVVAGLLFGLALLTGGGTLLLWQLDRSRRTTRSDDLPAYRDDSKAHEQYDDDIF